LKTDSGYPKHTGVILFTLATPGNPIRYNTHWSAPPVSAPSHSRGPGARQAEGLWQPPRATRSQPVPTRTHKKNHFFTYFRFHPLFFFPLPALPQIFILGWAGSTRIWKSNCENPKILIFIVSLKKIQERNPEGENLLGRGPRSPPLLLNLVLRRPISIFNQKFHGWACLWMAAGVERTVIERSKVFARVSLSQVTWRSWTGWKSEYTKNASGCRDDDTEVFLCCTTLTCPSCRSKLGLQDHHVSRRCVRVKKESVLGSLSNSVVSFFESRLFIENW